MNPLARNTSPGGSSPDHARHPLTGAPLVVVAGIPGAGKSTALDRLVADLQAGSAAHRSPGSNPIILDSASVRRWLRSRLPQVPYPVLRPVVHTTHWVRILAVTLTEPRPVVVHETATRPLARQALLALARCGQRPARLVWIDVPAHIALHGQVDRCRAVRPHAFTRHLHRIEQEHPAAAARRTWDAVCITDRDNAVTAILTACTPTENAHRAVTSPRSPNASPAATVSGWIAAAPTTVPGWIAAAPTTVSEWIAAAPTTVPAVWRVLISEPYRTKRCRSSGSSLDPVPSVLGREKKNVAPCPTSDRAQVSP